MSIRRLVALAGALVALTGCSDDGDTTPPSTESTATTAPSDPSGESSGTTPTTRTTTTTEPEPINLLPATFTHLSEPGVGGRITSIAFGPENRDRLLVGGDMLGIAITDDFGGSWSSTTGMASWEVGDITATPAADGRIWTGTLSGPHASADGGLTWSLERSGMPPIAPARYSLPIESVLVDPADDSRLLAFSGNQRNWEAPGAVFDGQWQGDGSVWVSDDAGESWSRLATVAPGGNVRAASFAGADATTVLAAVANQGVWVSSDSGASWQQRVEGLPHFNAYDIVGHPSDASVAWVALGEGPKVNERHLPGGIWRTTDGGASWQAVNDGLDIVANSTAIDTGSFHQIVLAPSDPDRLYTSNVAPGQAAVYRSDDGGTTWSVIADDSTPRPDAYGGALRGYDIAVHPLDPDRIAFGSDDTLLGSTDGGVTWVDLAADAVAPNLYAGRGYSGLVSTDIVFDTRRPEDVILLAFDGGNFIQSIDDGISWRRTVQPVSQWGGGVEAVYSPIDPATIYVLLGQFSNFRGIARSRDGGATFELLVGADRGLPESGNVDGGADGITALRGADTDVVLAAIGGRLLRSVDGGAAFSPVDGLQDVRDVAVTGDGATVFAATATGVFRSTDGGSLFTEVGGSPAGLTTLFPSTSEPGHIYAVAFRDGPGGVHRFDGSTWTQIFRDEFAHAVAIDPSDPDKIAVVTSEPAFHDLSNATGVYLSADGGATWTNFNEGLPMTRLRAVEFDPNEPDRVVVGTTGRGFYEVSFTKATGG